MVMRLTDVRILGACTGGGTALGALGGFLAAVAQGSGLVGGTLSGVIFVGGVLFVLGMFAAVEPPGGWAGVNARRREEGPRSVVTRIALQSERIEDVTSRDLALWALVVGGLPVALGIVLNTFFG